MNPENSMRIISNDHYVYSNQKSSRSFWMMMIHYGQPISILKTIVMCSPSQAPTKPTTWCHGNQLRLDLRSSFGQSAVKLFNSIVFTAGVPGGAAGMATTMWPWRCWPVGMVNQWTMIFRMAFTSNYYLCWYIDDSTRGRKKHIVICRQTGRDDESWCMISCHDVIVQGFVASNSNPTVSFYFWSCYAYIST